jgi:hypothetical protein
MAQWQGHTVAYLGVIWPSAKYADDLTAINMRTDVGGPPPAGLVASGRTAPSLNDTDLEARAREVAQLLGIDPDQLATQAPQAAGDKDARDTLVSTLQNATTVRRRNLADEQTKAEHDVAFNDTGSNLFFAIDHELQYLFTNVGAALTDNPVIRWLKQLRNDANAIIAHILNIFAYNEMKIRAGIVGRGLATLAHEPTGPSAKQETKVRRCHSAAQLSAAAITMTVIPLFRGATCGWNSGR